MAEKIKLIDRLMLEIDGAWSYPGNLVTYYHLAMQLIDRGFDEDEAVAFLKEAYQAAAAEF